MSTFILYGRVRVIDLSGSDLVYDAESQMNMVEAGGKLVPAIDQPIRLPTTSKTKQAPGDDDPDPGGEHLY